jgi:hypothetical protein
LPLKEFIMRTAFAGVFLIATVLAGCGGNALYLTPYNIDGLTCKELRDRANAAASRVNKSQELQERAQASAGGGAVSAFVYGPDYSRANFELSAYQQEAARKNCGDVTLPPGAVAAPPPGSEQAPSVAIPPPMAIRR